MAAFTPKAKQTLLTLADDLIARGEALSKVTYSERSVYNDWMKTEHRHQVTNFPAPAEDYFQWDAMCENFHRMLGAVGQRWEKHFLTSGQNISALTVKLGTLRGLREAIDRDLLVSTEDLIRAELFSDLFEQADYLLSQNYALAAGVLGRAVLEEHLRNGCVRAGCVPTNAKAKLPTLADYNQELYRKNILDKVAMKHVESMAAIGNDAAHNSPTLRHDDVQRLLQDLRGFLVNNPL